MEKAKGRKSAAPRALKKSSPVIELVKEEVVKEEIKKLSAEAIYFIVVFAVLALIVGVFGAAGVMAAVAKKGAVPAYKSPTVIAPTTNMFNNGTQVGIGSGLFNFGRRNPLNLNKNLNGVLTIDGDIKLSKIRQAPTVPEDRLYNLNGDLWWNTIKIGLWTKIPPTSSTLPDVIYLGNVGIGTYTPNAKLTVVSASTTMGSVTGNNHTASFSAPDQGPNESVIHYGDTGDWLIRSANSNGNVIMQDTGGKVGIGTNSPTEPLQIVGNNGSTEYRQLRLGTGGQSLYLGIGAGDAVIETDPASNKALYLQYGSTGNVIITPSNTSGKVGIGTENPTEKLAVSGNILSTGQVSIADRVIIGNDLIVNQWAPGGQEGAGGAILIKSGAAWFYLRNDSANLTIGEGAGDKFKINSDGTVSILKDGSFQSLQTLITTMQNNISTLQSNVTSLQNRVNALERCKCTPK